MKKLLSIILIFMCAIVLDNTYAVTKDDIINFADSQQVCGDYGVFNSYKSTFTRLLSQKNLTQSELDSIYSYLQSAVGILNNKGVCKIADVSKLTKEEKSNVLGSLYAGAGIITNAPNLAYEESNDIESGNAKDSPVENSKNNVSINTEEKTIDIYENGVLIDKVSMSDTKMTYTGNTPTYIGYTLLVVLIGALSVILIIAFRKHQKLKWLKNILVSIAISCFAVVGIYLLLYEKVDMVISAVNLMKFNTSDKTIKVELDETKKIIRYPSIGAKYASLNIPSLDILCDVTYGDTTDILNVSLAHSTWGGLPTEGEVVIYSGHNKEDMLGELQNIKLKEKIIVDTDYAKCTYVVEKTDVLKDTQVDKLVKMDDKETLIIYTCYPNNSYVYTDKRFVVYAVLDSVEWK